MFNQVAQEAKKTWADYEREEFTGKKQMIATKDECFYSDEHEFFQRCYDDGEEPEHFEPVIAKWRTAKLSVDAILDQFEEQVPDEDHGGDPIAERSHAQEIAQMANEYLEREKVGAYWPTKKALIIPADWRDQVTQF